MILRSARPALFLLSLGLLGCGDSAPPAEDSSSSSDGNTSGTTITTTTPPPTTNTSTTTGDSTSTGSVDSTTGPGTATTPLTSTDSGGSSSGGSSSDGGSSGGSSSGGESTGTTSGSSSSEGGSTGPDPCNAGDGPNFMVGNVGSFDYTFNGVADPTLVVVRGCTYTFDVDTPGHPFLIKSIQGVGAGNAYNDGVMNNGASIGVITWDVSMAAPDTLFYNCQFHGNMTGEFTVIDPM